MSRQLALSIVVSVLAMVSFLLLGQEAGIQLARDARMHVLVNAEYAPTPDFSRLLPILH
ncbi:MAG: hypothetical protein ACK4YM_05775 [Novosphingobium sp.]